MVVIIADDQGWGDLSHRGNHSLSTPHLDRLREQGTSFERFYVQPVCAPTRAELLTGRYAQRDGVRGVSNGAERLDPRTPTLADAFSAAGYRTAAFGKWHNGTQAPYHPLCRGFDTFYGFTSGHWGHYFDPLLDHDGRLTYGNGFLPNDLTDHAIHFLTGETTQPAFVWLAYNTPHSPMQVPDRWWQRHKDQELSERGTLAEQEDIDHTRAALAMVENLDWNVGRLLAGLDESNRARDTIVVYLSDNGPNGHRYNVGLRGKKGWTDEGGVRSPLLMRWPDHIPAGQTIEEPVAAIDVAPTLAELTGIELPSSVDRDGLSFAPLVTGEHSEMPPRTLFSYWNGSSAARRQTFLLDDQQRLYDLASDPNQTVDVGSEHPEITAQLTAELQEWKTRWQVDQPAVPRPFTVGDGCLPLTQLPARDATTRGNARHSNQYHNCTYITDWSSPDDAIAWDVEVVEPGRYAATLYYTCAEANVGSL
ncbi:MAG: arylsulfatase, partial [Planctomycetota bacterium]